jgi:hypothetical protein
MFKKEWKIVSMTSRGTDIFFLDSDGIVYKSTHGIDKFGAKDDFNLHLKPVNIIVEKKNDN